MEEEETKRTGRRYRCEGLNVDVAVAVADIAIWWTPSRGTLRKNESCSANIYIAKKFVLWKMQSTYLTDFNTFSVCQRANKFSQCTHSECVTAAATAVSCNRRCNRMAGRGVPWCVNKNPMHSRLTLTTRCFALKLTLIISFIFLVLYFTSSAALRQRLSLDQKRGEKGVGALAWVVLWGF